MSSSALQLPDWVLPEESGNPDRVEDEKSVAVRGFKCHDGSCGIFIKIDEDNPLSAGRCGRCGHVVASFERAIENVKDKQISCDNELNDKMYAAQKHWKQCGYCPVYERFTGYEDHVKALRSRRMKLCAKLNKVEKELVIAEQKADDFRDIAGAARGAYHSFCRYIKAIKDDVEDFMVSFREKELVKALKKAGGVRKKFVGDWINEEIGPHRINPIYSVSDEERRFLLSTPGCDDANDYYPSLRWKVKLCEIKWDPGNLKTYSSIYGCYVYVNVKALRHEHTFYGAACYCGSTRVIFEISVGNDFFIDVTVDNLGRRCARKGTATLLNGERIRGFVECLGCGYDARRDGGFKSHPKDDRNVDYRGDRSNDQSRKPQRVIHNKGGIIFRDSSRPEDGGGNFNANRARLTTPAPSHSQYGASIASAANTISTFRGIELNYSSTEDDGDNDDDDGAKSCNV